MDIKFSRIWAMPNHNTFDIEPIKDFVMKYLKQSTRSIDPFAGDSKLATIRNDLNPQREVDFHLSALDFINKMVMDNEKFDLMIFDPPYSLRQAKEVYENVGLKFLQRDTQIVGRWTAEKDNALKILTDSATVLSFGWNTQGMGYERGFEIVEILLICHGGAHNDTICMAEKQVMVQSKLDL